MIDRIMRTLLTLALVVSVVSACSRPADSPKAAAQAFLDTHYVSIDLEASRAFCVGLALDKLEREIELTRDNPMGADTRRPRISYKLHEADDAPDRAQYAYHLEVHPGGADVFRKLVVISMRRESEGWRVSNYSESDLADR
jgi:hypothetical protein